MYYCEPLNYSPHTFSEFIIAWCMAMEAWQGGHSAPNGLVVWPSMEAWQGGHSAPNGWVVWPSMEVWQEDIMDGW